MGKPVVEGTLAARLDGIRREMGGGIDAAEIRPILEDMITSISGDVVSADPAVIRELEELSTFIEETKAQIAAMRPEEIPDEHIPTATDELDAVVSATENATNAIMEAAEMVESVSANVDAESAAVLSDAVTRIYEACSFQDITGQRIGKVVGALKEIDAKVETVVERFGPDPETRERLKRERKARNEAAAEEGRVEDDADLLNGPQLPKNANSQDEIDALFADMG